MFGPSGSMGYDRSTVMYSPEGRIIQTEYAREAMRRGTIAIGIKSQAWCCSCRVTQVCRP